MQLLSINVGRPRLVQHRQQTLSTAIYKQSVAGPVEVSELGIAGDDQADKSAHGGIDKAVYAYPQEDYDWWREQLAGRELNPGEFGENLTTRGLVVDEVRIGDQFRIGTALLEVSQPRVPCLKLAIKWKDPTFVKRFHEANRPGFYLRVREVGTIEAGDAIELVERDHSSLTVTEIYHVRFDSTANLATLNRAAELPRLSEAWSSDFRKLIESR